MNPNILPDTRPLTEELEAALYECYHREQHNIEPFVTCTYDATFELIERGFLSAKTIMKNKRALYGFYVTQSGIDYLSSL